jgi:hypothetical protein
MAALIIYTYLSIHVKFVVDTGGFRTTLTRSTWRITIPSIKDLRRRRRRRRRRRMAKR